VRLIVTVVVCVLAPTVYTLLSLASVVPMTVPIFLGWLVWLQAVHVVAGVALWRRRATLSTRIKAALLSWGGLAVWYWLPAPVYFVLTMNLDELQVAWTALTFFWEVPVVGGAFVLAAQRLYPARARRGQDRDPALRYREVMRYPTLVAGLLFVFTLAGYALGTLQLRIFAALPPIEQVKNLSHGIVISLLLAVFYYLALDRMLEPARTRIAREAGVGVMVVRTVAGRILGVTLAVAISGFALSSLFVLQAFQVMVRESATTTLTRDLAQLAEAPDAGHQLGAVPRWGERGQLRLVHAGEALPAADFAPATRALVAGRSVGVVPDSRGDLKVVGVVDAQHLGGRLVGVIFLTDAYGPLRSAARFLVLAAVSVLVVTVGMLVFASRASTQAVRALSSAVRRVEAGQVDETVLRLETGDEIGELSAVVERYVRQSHDLRENLEEKVRDKTRRLQTLQHIDRSILAAESAEAIARAALPRLRSIVPCTWSAVLLLEGDTGEARVMATDGTGGPAEGQVLPLTALPAGAVLGAPLEVGGEPIGVLCIAGSPPGGVDDDHAEIVGEVANQLAVAIHGARLREALDHQQQRLQELVEHLPEGVLLIERDGRIALANPFARAQLAAVAMLSPEGHVTDVGGLSLARLLAAPGIEPVEIAAGGVRVFQVATRRLDAAHGVVVVIRDVTREREAQKAEQQQARLAAVGQLAAGIAHDFNNILMTIVNSAELAQRRYSDATFVNGRLDLIVEQGERAAALVRQILDFSRQSPPSLQPLDLSGLVQETIELLQRTLPATIGIALEADAGSFPVSADPNQLRQVLTNLAVNARDAMPLGGELRFRLSHRHDDAGPEQGSAEWLVIEVTDTGVGMPADVRERIFEPFFTTKAPGRGTGLGLSQAYGIVEQHGGRITVESGAERGTTFTITLPALAEDPAAAAAADDPTLFTGQGETVLIVEDEVPVRHTLAQILGDLNYHVLVAPSAEDAVTVYDAHAGEVALVLTDLVMPGMGGIGLLRALRERACRAPIVMMSGYVGEAASETITGVSAWVQKPVSARRLGQIIQEALTAPV
jgi:signal transduction histidine kinase